MRRRFAAPVAAFGLETVVFVCAVVVAPGRTSLLTHVFLVVIAAEALGACAFALARSLRASEPSQFELGLSRPVREVERPGQLARLEREVTLGRQTAWDLHARLLPTLREVAAGLLSAHGGVTLAHEPDRAAAVLGADAWELVRTDRPRPEHRHDPGVDAAALDRALASLERLR